MMLRRLLGHRRYCPASTRRRLLAEAIDGAIFAPPFLAYGLYESRRSGEKAHESARAGPLRHALELLSLALAVQAELGHTPGFRRLGLKVVDARTGAELELPTAMARVAIVRIPGYLAKEAMGRSKLRVRANEPLRRLQRLEPQLEDLRAKHKDDDQALQAATMALYKQEDVNPFASCTPALAQLALAIPTGLAARRLRDRLTGKTLIIESIR